MFQTILTVVGQLCFFVLAGAIFYIIETRTAALTVLWFASLSTVSLNALCPVVLPRSRLTSWCRGGGMESTSGG